MKKETLERAIALKSRITFLKNNIKEVNNLKDWDIVLYTWNCKVTLQSSMLPINKEILIEQYISNKEAEIELLNQELENL